MSSCNHKRRAIYNSEDVCSFKLLNLSELLSSLFPSKDLYYNNIVFAIYRIHTHGIYQGEIQRDLRQNVSQDIWNIKVCSH